MAALMHPRYDFGEYEEDEYEELEQLRELEIGRAPARPRLALVGEPRAAVRRSPRTTRATYRRRRIVAAVVALGIVVAVGRVGASLGGSSLVTPERPPASASVSTFVVQPGDSLWSIAKRIAPGADPRPIVDALARDRRDVPLRPGEVIEYRGWSPK
ncbi:MAG: hypothetical protein ACXW2C_06105 [Acidimicrobiia bacterium]